MNFYSALALVFSGLLSSSYAGERGPAGALDSKLMGAIAASNMHRDNNRDSAVGIKFIYEMQQEAKRNGISLSRSELTRAAYEIRAATKEAVERRRGKTGNSTQDAIRDSSGVVAELLITALATPLHATKLPGVRQLFKKATKASTKAFNSAVRVGLGKAGGKLTEKVATYGLAIIGVDAPDTDERSEIAAKHAGDFEYAYLNMDKFIEEAKADPALAGAYRDSGYETEDMKISFDSLEITLALNPQFKSLLGIEKINEAMKRLEDKSLSKEQFEAAYQDIVGSMALSNVNTSIQLEQVLAILNDPEKLGHEKKEATRAEIKQYIDGAQMPVALISFLIKDKDPRAARILGASGDAAAKTAMLITDLVLGNLAKTAIMSSVCFVAGLAQIASDLIGSIIGGPSETQMILDAIQNLSKQLTGVEANLTAQITGLSNQIDNVLHTLIESFADMSRHLSGVNGSLERALDGIAQANQRIRDLGMAVNYSTADLKSLTISLDLAHCAAADEESFVRCIAVYKTALASTTDVNSSGPHIRKFEAGDEESIVEKLSEIGPSQFRSLNLLADLACLVYGDESMGSMCSAGVEETSASRAIGNPAEWSVRTQGLLDYLGARQRFISLQKREVRIALNEAYNIGDRARRNLSAIGSMADGSSAILNALAQYTQSQAELPIQIVGARKEYEIDQLKGHSLNAKVESIEVKNHQPKNFGPVDTICHSSLVSDGALRYDTATHQLPMGDWVTKLMPSFLVLADQMGSEIRPEGAATDAAGEYKMRLCIEAVGWEETYTRAQVNSLANTRKNIQDTVSSDKFDEIPFEKRVKMKAMHERLQKYLDEDDTTSRHEDNILFSPEDVAVLDEAWQYNHWLKILPGEQPKVVLKNVYQFGKPYFVVRVYFAHKDTAENRKLSVGRIKFKLNQVVQYGVGEVKQNFFDSNAPKEKDGFRTGDYPDRVFISIDQNKHLPFFDIVNAEFQAKHQLVPADVDAEENILARRIIDGAPGQMKELKRHLGNADHDQVTPQLIQEAGFSFELEPNYSERVLNGLKLLWADKRKDFAMNATAALSGKMEEVRPSLLNGAAFKGLGRVAAKIEMHRLLLSKFLALSFPESVHEMDNVALYDLVHFDDVAVGRGYFEGFRERLATTPTIAENEPFTENLAEAYPNFKVDQAEDFGESAAGGRMAKSIVIDPDMTDLFQQNNERLNALHKKVTALVERRTLASHLDSPAAGNAKGNLEYFQVIQKTLSQIDDKRREIENQLNGRNINEVFFELKSKLSSKYGSK